MTSTGDSVTAATHFKACTSRALDGQHASLRLTKVSGWSLSPRAHLSAKRRAHLASDMAAPMVSPLLMLLLAGASAFAPPRAAHALLRASAAPKLSSIVMEDRVFALKIPLGDVRSWLGLGLAS